MISSTRIAILIASLALLIAITTVSTAARELRPSYHGLEYQSPPPSSEQTPQEVKSFFKGSMSPPTQENVALPKAMNSTDTSLWWSSGGSHEGRDRARRVMLVASLVCGATGVTLLVASAFIYFFRYRKRKSPSSFVDNHTINTK
ncbi:hypothetical protein LWI29_006246 [Acer saccharum]|uniref:Transmembrane protein n=1 Tax=Acer saccharum TaxID=4024 RepID=A0AA39VFJ8_ACESA|nr:hypothetical protein LWI29_006246 [Acer saccharum]